MCVCVCDGSLFCLWMYACFLGFFKMYFFFPQGSRRVMRSCEIPFPPEKMVDAKLAFTYELPVSLAQRVCVCVCNVHFFRNQLNLLQSTHTLSKERAAFLCCVCSDASDTSTAPFAATRPCVRAASISVACCSSH